MFGEKHLGKERARRAAQIHAPYARWLAELCRQVDIDWQSEGEATEPLSRLSQTVAEIPAIVEKRLLRPVMQVTGQPVRRPPSSR